MRLITDVTLPYIMAVHSLHVRDDAKAQPKHDDSDNGNSNPRA